MKLIFEAGATSTSIALLNDGSCLDMLSVEGINPYHHSPAYIRNVLSSGKIDYADVEKIHFFGAGCKGLAAKQMIRNSLHHLTTAQVEVESDILASCIACCGNSSGLVGILGTGSKIAFYDGESIIKEDFSKGYLLGDYGSAFHIGQGYLRLLLDDQLNKELVSKSLLLLTANDKGDFLNQIYKSEDQKKLIAYFAKIAHEHRNLPVIQEMISKCLTAFFKTFVHWNQDGIIHFTGSTAYYFREELKEIANAHGYEIGQIIKKPMDKLVEYFLNK